MGGGKPLVPTVKENLVKALSGISHSFSVLAYVDNAAVGLVNCFEGFSTFLCKPLVNIHDITVLEKYRGNGISQLMLAKVEEIARAKGCCKLTLEVLSNNRAAKSAYRKFGFSDYELDPEAGTALFWQKYLQ
jgi:ribosomal protein S18 acetylase RimI-like enzyme